MFRFSILDMGLGFAGVHFPRWFAEHAPCQLPPRYLCYQLWRSGLCHEEDVASEREMPLFQGLAI